MSHVLSEEQAIQIASLFALLDAPRLFSHQTRNQCEGNQELLNVYKRILVDM
jgi:hypothetical protein